MRYRSLSRTAPPTVTPVTLEEVRAHVRVEEDDNEIAYLGSLVAAATGYIEDRRGEALLDQQWTMTLDAFPWSNGPICLPRPPLRSVTAITYVDTQGATQTLSPSLYRVIAAAKPAEIHPVYGTTWPSTLTDPGSVAVVYRAGYGTAGSAVPEGLRQACKIMVATWFEQRESLVVGAGVAKVPHTADALIDLTRTEW